ncbi:MAG: hypothetical protein ACK5DL_03820 [Burkholderiales bacterium]|nr:hypothetical protein [Betaproteobacteria bacterium]
MATEINPDLVLEMVGWRRVLMRVALAVFFFAAAPLALATSGEKIRCIPNDQDGPRVVFLKDIDVGDDKIFAAAYSSCFPRGQKRQPIVDLYSGGGVVSVALNIASFLRRASEVTPVRTRVVLGGYCVSACTYIFLSGTFREVPQGSSFEPHGFSSFLGNPISDAMSRTGDIEIAKGRLWFVLDLINSISTVEGRPLMWLGGVRRAWNDETPNGDRLIVNSLRATGVPLQLINDLDAALRVVMPELQREVALNVLLDRLNAERQNFRDLEAIHRHYVGWIAARLSAAADKEWGVSRAARVDPRVGDVQTKIANIVAEVIRLSEETAAAKLWPMLQTLKNEVNVEGLTRLMFSTSILYVRPLTREELCDTNIVNVGCQ